MAYESVDKLQKALAEGVFSDRIDSKKAAGRALGTFVEIISYYLLKTWGLNNQISIERKIQEYGNSGISHNVEFSLHPILAHTILKIEKTDKSITSNAILKALKATGYNVEKFKGESNQLLSAGILRNACTIATSDCSYLLCSILNETHDSYMLNIYEQSTKQYAIFECKRVGGRGGNDQRTTNY